ncbi:alpha/beta hydrolase family protein [Prochlorococcus marinus]|uniref:Esterase/lipase/thioesterase family active site n=1 Tax=Prochlorococcus marinus (strain MIT 9211) TaxID=93059 RepID=A9B9D1_PROM4|nr:prolyl oligopeptidase family serine peptidase [Prochlorococcus marinus]ABX08008.1 Esterase/lipase/thioesterase family active site [Prochlorococcus marinus str. MIT 9211]
MVSPKNQVSSKFLDAEVVLGEFPKIKSPRILGDWVFWLEQRPYENGRTTLLTRPWGRFDCLPQELTPFPVNLRTRLHGYGGSPLALVKQADCFVMTWIDDQQGGLWHQKWIIADQTKPTILKSLSSPICLSLKDKYCLADGLIDLQFNRWIGVMEEDNKDYLVSFALDKELKAPMILHQAIDFLGYPTLSIKSDQLAWVEWQKPYMPWDQSQIFHSFINDIGKLSSVSMLSGSDKSSQKSSAFQPQWLPNGQLIVAEDSSGWWNLKIAGPDFSSNLTNQFSNLWHIKAEAACPQWIHGMSTIASSGKKEIVALSCQEGSWSMSVVNKSGSVTKLQLPFEHFEDVSSEEGKAVAIAANSFLDSGLLEVNLKNGSWIHNSFRESIVKPQEISIAESFWFKGFGGEMSHAWYYPPIQGRLNYSPLLVKAHSGPTSMAKRGLNLEIQFWTSRGWGVLDVNYAGSTGFGRAYRDRLKHSWGEADVFDCSQAAMELINNGKADKNLVAIEGSSAGGFTSLCCLCFRNIFRVASCKYPVIDLLDMANSTHRFEEYYLDFLIGKFNNNKHLYMSRSPINNLDKITCPVILFQGLKDKVVSPEKTKDLFTALKNKKIPTELHVFDNEGHGFNHRSTKIKVLRETESFFREHLGI